MGLEQSMTLVVGVVPFPEVRVGLSPPSAGGDKGSRGVP